MLPHNLMFPILPRKRKNHLRLPFFIFSIMEPRYKKTNLTQEQFIEDFVLYISKGYCPLNSIENIWLKRLIFHQCNWVVFFSKQQLTTEVSPMMVSKTMERYVFPTLVETTTMTITFDLWMSWKGFDTFAIVVNYIKKQWETCHITIRIFEVHEISNVTMVIQLRDSLAWYELLDKVIAYFKDEGANFNTFTTTLTNIVSCVPL